MRHPYEGLPYHHFWRRAISRIEKHAIHPVGEVKMRISPGEKVITAGSCFAQHFSRALVSHGLPYLVTEGGNELSDAERIRRNYRVYSARTGNIYTVRQLNQLLQEAFIGSLPRELCWVRSDGRIVDALRPLIEPDGFKDETEMLASRQVMLEAVRQMVLQGDVLIFTLGLTECWCSQLDGWVFPLAPGSAGGAFDRSRHRFWNAGVNDVRADLEQAMELAHRHNPNLRLVLTVSPVPLIATYEPCHVLTATTYSKAVLRAVAGEMARDHQWCSYFPSYEIITGPHAAGSYYDEDLREVRAEGVSHVLRVAAETLFDLDSRTTSHPEALTDQSYQLVCDEVAINQLLG